MNSATLSWWSNFRSPDKKGVSGHEPSPLCTLLAKLGTHGDACVGAAPRSVTYLWVAAARFLNLPAVPLLRRVPFRLTTHNSYIEEPGKILQLLHSLPQELTDEGCVGICTNGASAQPSRL